MFQTEYVVAGVAPLGANLVVLAEALDAPISGRGARPRPEVRVVTRKNEDLSRDALAVRGCDSLGPGDAFLAPVRTLMVEIHSMLGVRAILPAMAARNFTHGKHGEYHVFTRA